MQSANKWLNALLCMTAVTVTACADPLDTERHNVRDASPGEAIYEELCNRVAIESDRHDVSGRRAQAVCRDGQAPAAAQGARLQALHGQRQRVIGALDAALANGTAHATQELIGALAPLYDVPAASPSLMRRTVAAQTDVVASVASNAHALTALGLLGARQGYAPADLEWGWLLRNLDYPHLHQLAGAVLPVLAEGGQGHLDLHQLLKAASAQLEHDPQGLVAQGDGEFAALRSFLLQPMPAARGTALVPKAEHAAMHARLRGGARGPLPVVQRDARGVVQVALRDGTVPAPFVDRDGDGLADIDASGAFVDAAGAPLSVPTPFALHTEVAGTVPRNSLGQALGADGKPLYVYADLSHAVLSAATAQVGALIHHDPPQAVAWSRALQATLGSQTDVVHEFGHNKDLKFVGYDANRTPLVDIAQAVGALASKDVLPQVIELGARLLQNNEADIAALVRLGWQIHDWANAPGMEGVALEPNNVFTDDMIEVFTEIAREPGLLDDLLRSMNDPATQRAGQLFAKHMRVRDYIELDLDNVNGPPVGRLVTPVDRTQGDLRDNRSVFQRILDLVHDASGLQMCNAQIAPGPGYEYAPCEMYQIDDAAIFYVQAIVGQARMAMHLTGEDVEFFQQQADAEGLEFMENMTGIKGFTKIAFTPAKSPEELAEFVYSVTPEASTRLLFAPYYDGVTNPEAAQRLAIARLILGDVMLDDNQLFAAVHHGTLFAWELEGFFDAVRPMLKAFADHGREDLIVKAMVILHRHYATHASDTTQNKDHARHDFSYQTGLELYEPVLARALDEGQAMGLLGALNSAAANTPVGHGAVARPGDALIAELSRDILLPERNPGMTFFNGDTYGRKSDGSAMVSRLSPAVVLKSALFAISDRLDALTGDSPGVAAAHRFALSAAQTYLTVEPYGKGFRLRNRQAKALALAFMDYAKARLLHHRDLGDLDRVREDLPQAVHDVLAHPLTTAALNLLGSVADDAAAAQAASDWVAYLLGPARNDTVVGASQVLAALTDANTTVPLMQATLPMFAQDTGLLALGVSLLNQVQRLDKEQTLAKLLAGLARLDGGLGAAPLPVLADAYAVVNRAQPGQGGALRAADFGTVLGTLRDFLRDDNTGLGRLLTITEQRTLP